MTFATLRAAVRPYRTPVFLIGAVVALALALGPRLVFGPEVPVTAVVQRDFVQSVVASGHVETPHRVSVGAQVTGTVARIPVAEGQVVARGQVLVELENAELRATATQAELAVRQAEARLRQLRELQAPVAEQALRQAQVSLDNARAAARRAEELLRQGFIGQAAYDDARKAVDLGEAQLRSAKTQLETTGPRGSDYAMAASALAQGEASATAARSRLGYATIVAPAAGTLIDRNVERGDVVQPGKVLMVLSPAGETQLVVQIDEKNLRLLAPGQAAQVSADAYPDRRFAARLAYINPGIDAQRGSVEVKLEVPAPPDYLRQDMTVSVDIQVAERSRAVLLPTDAVHEIDSAAPWVLRVEAGHARRRNVRIGLRGGGMSEVLDGLRPGDLVVASVAADVADGARVRPMSDVAVARAPLP
ncbi:MAG: efflux RND transporter periplasmic adaptor subunit [Caldimonas sp.]